MDSPQSEQGTYKAVPIDDAETATLSYISLDELQDPKDIKSPSLQARSVVEGKSPAKIQASVWHYAGHGVVDGMLTFGPVFFFVIAGLCINLSGKPVSPYGENIKAITLLSPTIFPIIYAAILGKFLRRLGLYKVERGTSIGDLERLIGCQSVFSTLERQVGLRRYDFLGVSILIAWLLSPLGGQASLRLLSTSSVIIKDNHSSILYYPTEQILNHSMMSSGSPLFTPLFMTALQTSRRRLDASMDLFGNVKVPHVSAVTDPKGNGTHGNWLPIENDTNIQYTSIFGVPIAGVPDSGNASFNLISHYWVIDCAVLQESRVAGSPSEGAWQRLFANETTNLRTISPLTPSFDIVLNETRSTENNVSFAFETRSSANFTLPSVSTIPCSAALVLVESIVFCSDKMCRVRAVRPFNQSAPKFWGEITPLKIFKVIGETFPGVDISATQNISFGNELVERWIYNPNLGANVLQEGWLDLSVLQWEVFNRRLMMVINTFWDSMVGSIIRTDSLTKDYVLAQNWQWANAPMSTARYDGLQYVCNLSLAVVTMLISALLLLAANLSMLLGIVTRTPDILGFVSVSARDNPHFGVKTSNTCSGLDAARQLQHVRVTIGDVRGDEDVGHIAFTTSDKKPRRLSWSRYYD